MANLYQGIEVFVEPLGLMIAVVFLYGIIGRSMGSSWVRQLIFGGFFGLAAVYSMFNPIPLAEGVIIDVRNMFVGLSSALLGPLAGLITLAISMLTRVSIGGVGMQSGLLAMAFTSIAGLAWRQFILPRKIRNFTKTFILGLMVSLHLLAAFTLPPEVVYRFMTGLAPFLVVANLVGTFALSALITRERGLIEETENLMEAAATDPLTQLLNRRSTEFAVANLPDLRTPGNGRAILYYDVDNFKGINDTYGHAAGDAILKGITARIEDCLRPQDLYSRLGGDEFAIILPDVTRRDAHTIAERCRAAVEHLRLDFEGGTYSVTISIGVRWSANPPDFAEQLAQADSALYSAKIGGRNQVAFETSADSPDRATAPHES